MCEDRPVLLPRLNAGVADATSRLRPCVYDHLRVAGIWEGLVDLPSVELGL